MNVYNSHVTKCVMTLMEDLNALVMTDMSLLWIKQSAMVWETLIGLGHDIVNSLTSLDLQDQVMLHNLVPMHINGTCKNNIIQLQIKCTQISMSAQWLLSMEQRSVCHLCSVSILLAATDVNALEEPYSLMEFAWK